MKGGSGFGFGVHRTSLSRDVVQWKGGTGLNLERKEKKRRGKTGTLIVEFVFVAMQCVTRGPLMAAFAISFMYI